jgi:tetratricopeptide (TPR) repeat protein
MHTTACASLLLIAVATVAHAAPARDPDAEAIVEAARAAKDRAALEAQLPKIEALIAAKDGAQRRFVRAMILSALGRKPDALADYQKAAALDPTFGDAFYNVGTIQADLGHEADAVAAWEQAAKVDPKNVDALYNLGQYYYNHKQLEKAGDRWAAAYRAAPGDFGILKKVVQVAYGLGRFEEGERLRAEAVEVWKRSTDPATQRLTEYVFDQFDAGDQRIFATALLKQPEPKYVEILYSFRATRNDRPTGDRIEVETSEVARKAGTPYVLTTTMNGRHQVVGSSANLPPYPELRKTVIDLFVKPRK